jgi:2-methylcitrate dehydratase PrpD
MRSYVKPYACARWIHSSLDAVGAIMRSEGLTADDVDSIEIDTFEFASMLDAVAIQSDLHARFSVPYCVATLVVDGELHASGFLEAARSREVVADLAKRVVLREDPAYSAALPQERPTRATIHTTGGATHCVEVRRPRGNPETALEADEVVAKFRSNVGDTVPGGVVDDLVAAVLGGPEQHTGRAVAALAAAVLDYAEENQ